MITISECIIEITQRTEEDGVMAIRDAPLQAVVKLRREAEGMPSSPQTYTVPHVKMVSLDVDRCPEPADWDPFGSSYLSRNPLHIAPRKHFFVIELEY